MRAFFIVVLFVFLSGIVRAEDDVLSRLQQIKEVSDIQKVVENAFSEYYVFKFEQLVDHENASSGTFKQRVCLGHKKMGAPVVVELEGYGLKYRAEEELSNLLAANQIKIEHRFFDESVPEAGIQWEFLTIKQAAADHHKIIQALKEKVYPSSGWISSGISKGGQAVIFHRYFYPDDVSLSVPYVAPLNLAQVDPRINRFLNKLGVNKGSVRKAIWGTTDDVEECFWRVRDFQVVCFKNLEQLLPKLEAEASQKGYTFQDVGGVKEALQMMILEYQFAFWQWGYECKDIPREEALLDEVYAHLALVSSPSFFEDKEIKKMQPYFYSAFTEIGMYDYDVKPFRKYLKVKENVTFSFAWPESVLPKSFDGTQMLDIERWLQNKAEKMLFIYGGQDPWFATSVDLKDNSNCSKYVKADMHHGCRIGSFERITRQDIMDTLKEWLK